MNASFSARLISWQRTFGRHELPWQNCNPYHVWLSEIMLQQTQVVTVIPYFQRFIARFPDIATLAAAPEEEVLFLWRGLGYYARARNLHAAAQYVVHQLNGQLPNTRAQLEQLKGVGRSTAAAICVFAFGKKEAICDGNVRRVLTRHHGILDFIEAPKTQQQLWTLAEALLPDAADDLRSYTQGLMDLGSLICTRARPKCADCPVKTDCYALKNQQQMQLPRRKPKKAPPARNGYFVLCRNDDGEIYLQKRARRGIWGGLWSLPWFETEHEAKMWIAAQGFSWQSSSDSPVMMHRFTHFHLSMYLLTAQTTQKSTDFYAPDAVAQMALPAPLMTLLGAENDPQKPLFS